MSAPDRSDKPGGAATAAVAAEAQGRRLLAMIGNSARSYPLPERGSLLIGRAETAPVCIEDPSVSRNHAMLHLGPPIRIEDLGSHNGTQVRGETIASGASAELSTGEPFRVGGVTLVVVDPEIASASAVESSDALIVADPAMTQICDLLDRVAQTDLAVLLLGETGVGKDMLAHRLHARSGRANEPLVAINCASLAESLIESELFGHEAGAFTGALRATPGLIESSAGGTLFLDEIGDLTPRLQAKLLHVLERREVLRIGARTPRQVMCRFVSATNRDLEQAVAAGTFRADLYYRLSGLVLVIPPLRDRRVEIEPLARAFAAHATRRLARPRVPSIEPAALALLQAHSWPGNLRELRNVIERGVLLCGGSTIEPQHIVLGQPSARSPEPAAVEARNVAELDPEHADERQRIVDALAKHGGNQKAAAAALGMSRPTLAARMERYGLPRPRK